VSRASGRGTSNGRLALAVALALLVLVLLENAVLAARMQHLPRLATDFSATYLDRELTALAHESPRTVFLGDSVLWGYRVEPEQTAIAQFEARGVRSENLAFKAANPATDYFLLQLLLQRGARPARVVLEINQQVFNPFDQSYRSLHPGILGLARPLLTAADVRRLRVAVENWPQARLESLASRLWLAYGMRSDVRETWIESPTSVPLPKLTSELFTMTYDQAPLRASNVGVVYLKKTAALLQSQRIPAVAFLTPVNHRLLHEFIDNPDYRANQTYLMRILREHGIRTLDLDAALPGGDFFDNDHLNEKGQADLARLLEPAL